MDIDEEYGRVNALMSQYPRLFQRPAPSLEVWYPRGWEQLMQRLCTDLNGLLDDKQAARFRVDQVKEKYGTLRFYYAVGSRSKVNVDVAYPGEHERIVTSPKITGGFPAAKVDALIRKAEAESAVICASCGAPGVLRRDGWLRVSCDACEERRRRELREGDGQMR